ncbi:MAG: hypothetical protein Q8K18_11865 [Burkholderiales bacterium]|nr:hypothetical protein [Burkholderiales bacterium]
MAALMHYHNGGAINKTRYLFNGRTFGSGVFSNKSQRPKRHPGHGFQVRPPGSAANYLFVIGIAANRIYNVGKAGACLCPGLRIAKARMAKRAPPAGNRTGGLALK